ncbi:hypothetical protein ART_1616 [Arthrobacter sp. PAMC 25486]|uniref:hypothetical protein n=1 Tax=Arthrobacter sp. PAMC 25486 TaxID=1494608 RepID=UPI0005363EB1|nr:hypothetical protein [Arthrobacter sp. PAMC 25486]AIY01215.1 hypothetical protein ART_1616 [Arthrobacter sp. PAMC 25486]
MLDGLELNGMNRYGECIVTDLVGWRGRPGVKSQDVSAPNSDGDVDLPAHNAARNVTISGTLIPSQPAQLQEFLDRLGGLLQGDGTVAGDQLAGGRLQVGWHHSTRWAPVKWDGELQDDYAGQGDDMRLNFTIPLKSPRPQKFGDVQKVVIPASTSYTDIFHRGNTVAYPVVVVSGSAPGGYTMRTPGGTTYQVTRPLVSGTPHTIDMRTGRLMVGNQFVAGQVTYSGIFRVWQGRSISVRIQPLTTGSPVMTVSTFDTYI